MKTLSDATKAAKELGCELETFWTGVSWHVVLWSPSKMIFGKLNSHCETKLSINRTCKKYIDWSKTIEEIKLICSDLLPCEEEDCEMCRYKEK